jgi:hypothetical protein
MRRSKQKGPLLKQRAFEEPPVRFELTTCSLRVSCSTPEPRWPIQYGMRKWECRMKAFVVHSAFRIPECRDPDSNWGLLHFQCSALPTELSRREPAVPKRAMRLELTTFSLARRRSTTELRPQGGEGLPPLREVVGARGFEPPTSRSRSVCATGLRYAPTFER